MGYMATLQCEINKLKDYIHIYFTCKNYFNVDKCQKFVTQAKGLKFQNKIQRFVKKKEKEIISLMRFPT